MDKTISIASEIPAAVTATLANRPSKSPGSSLAQSGVKRPP
jgi:hypothetical protein